MSTSFLEQISVPADNLLRRIYRMRTGVVRSAELLTESLQSGGFRYRAAFITLTYRDDASWDPRDISQCLAHYRKWAKRRGCFISYVWVLELTKRQRPHYHIVLFLPRGLTPPLPDKQGWWRKGCTNAKWARSAVRYLAKYAGKDVVGSLPHGSRLWGCSSLGVALRARLRWFLAPSWVRQFIPIEDGVRRFHSWWVNASTGYAYLSPWIYDGISGNDVLLRYIGWPSANSVFVPLSPLDSPPWPLPDAI